MGLFDFLTRDKAPVFKIGIEEQHYPVYTNAKGETVEMTPEQYKNVQSESTPEDVSLTYGIATMPMGLGATATKGLATKLMPHFGKKIAQQTAEGIGGGLAGGTVMGGIDAAQNGENVPLGMLTGGTIGALTGGALGLGGGYIGKSFAKRGLLDNEQAKTNYIYDYLTGLSPDNQKKELDEFRRLWWTGYDSRPEASEILLDTLENNNGLPLKVLHGTASNFDRFDKSKLGSLTGAKSAKEGFWFTEGNNTAQSYANYAAENTGINKLLKQQNIAEKTRNWDLYDRLTEEIENIALNAEKPSPRIIEANLDINNLAKYDAQGKRFMEIQDEINNFIDSNPKADGFLFENLRDAVDNSLDEAVNHYMVRNPEQITILDPKFSDLQRNQFHIIQKNNPMLDDYHTGIRKLEDIKTPEEVFNINNFAGTPDFKFSDASKALKDNIITVYSSKPLESGSFITPSKMQAKDYAGGGDVYSARIPLNDYVPIDSLEGQYAPTEHLKYNLSRPLKFRENNYTILDRSVPELYFEPDEYAPLSSAFSTYAMQNQIKNTGLTKPHFDYYFDTYIDDLSTPHFLRIKNK